MGLDRTNHEEYTELKLVCHREDCDRSQTFYIPDDPDKVDDQPETMPWMIASRQNRYRVELVVRCPVHQ